MNFSMYISKLKSVSTVFLFKHFYNDYHSQNDKIYVSGRHATRRLSVGGDNM
jgi:hypothetical protein